MSFGYATLEGKVENPTHVDLEQYNLASGPKLSIKDSHEIEHQMQHPLQRAERNRLIWEHQLNMNMLRNVQGIHAPLRIDMELKAFNNVGRLPFLRSSNLSRDVLLGRDYYVDFQDILNPSDVHEGLNQPHVAMGKKIGNL